MLNTANQFMMKSKKHLMAWVNNNSPKTLMLYSAVGVFVIFIILILLALLIESGGSHRNRDAQTISSTQPHQKTRDAMGEQLNDLSIKLAHIEHALSDKDSVVNLDPLRDAIANVQRQTKQLANKSNQLIKSAIDENTAMLKAHLDMISKQLKTLQERTKKVSFMSPSDLPFKVISINNIQQNDIVTLRYNHTTFPLNIGEYLAGWRLIHADFSLQRTEFVNKEKQHVMVSLNRKSLNFKRRG